MASQQGRNQVARMEARSLAEAKPLLATGSTFRHASELDWPATVSIAETTPQKGHPYLLSPFFTHFRRAFWGPFTRLPHAAVFLNTKRGGSPGGVTKLVGGVGRTDTTLQGLIDRSNAGDPASRFVDRAQRPMFYGQKPPLQRMWREPNAVSAKTKKLWEKLLRNGDSLIPLGLETRFPGP